MKIEYMRYFLEIASCASINKAAENLYLSQQNLNICLKNMEKELGCKLCQRSYAGVTLTKEGKMAAQRFEQILREMEGLQSDIAKQSTQSGKGADCFYELLIITSLVVPAAPIMEVLLHQKNIHRVHFSLFYKDNPDIEQNIANRKPGLFLLNEEDCLEKFCSILDKSAWHIKLIATCGLFVVVGEHHPLARQKTVTLKSAVKYPMAIFQLMEEQTTGIECFLQSRVFPKIHYRTNEAAVWERIIAKGLAISFDFRYHQKAFHDASTGLVRIPVSDYKETQIVSICLQSYYEDRQVIIDELEENLHQRLRTKFQY